MNLGRCEEEEPLDASKPSLDGETRRGLVDGRPGEGEGHVDDGCAEVQVDGWWWRSSLLVDSCRQSLAGQMRLVQCRAAAKALS